MNKKNIAGLIFILAIVLCTVLILMKLSKGIFRGYVWDDSYMYLRYANNLINYGRISWNPGGEPTYGLTAPLYLSIVLPLYLIVGNPAFTLFFSSFFCGLVFIGLLVFLLIKYMDTRIEIKWLFLGLLFLSFGITSRLVNHFITGMDTCFALAVLTGYIIIMKWYNSHPTTSRAVLAGIWGGLVFWSRPDMMLYSAIIPASCYLFTRDKDHKKKALLILGISGGALLAVIILNHYLLGSFLPLPFYAKSTKAYGESVYIASRNIAGIQFVNYFKNHAWLVIIILSDILLNFKKWKNEALPVEKGLLIAVCFFIIYYRFFVLQVMGYNSRFYYPTLPAIIFLASQSLINLSEYIKPLAQSFLNGAKSNIKKSLLFVLAVLLALAPAGYLINRTKSYASWLEDVLSNDKLTSLSVQDILTTPNVMLNPKSWENFYWIGIRRFALLPADLVAATTEIGYSGLIFDNKVVVDLAALNESEFALKGFSVDRLFEKYAPDLLYMPHHSYEEMNREIRDNLFFKNNYDYYPASVLGNTFKLEVALKKTSPYYKEMQNIVKDELAKVNPE